MKYLFASILLLCSACSSRQVNYSPEGKVITIPTNVTKEAVIKLATEVRPSYRQIDYQQREMLGFIHIGMNTFTGREWGTGQEDPSIFNPFELDAEKWVKTFKDAGITGVILVAKHHDGFCTWPSKYTDHSVAHSPWRDGKGDLVREVSDACKKLDMKFCIYMSPWDMHEASYGTEAYNDYYIHQMEELLTNYGPVYLFWFDGAGTTGKPEETKMNFDWDRYFNRARELQPNILLSGNKDIRWVGNEAGRGKETEWCVQGINGTHGEFANQGDLKLGTIEDLMTKQKLVWYPSRGGLPLRKGWFYNSNDDNTTKSLEYLVDSYFSTIGQNANLLPNLSPDTTGRFPEKDANRLIEFGRIITEMKKVDFAKDAETIPVSGWDKQCKTGILTDDDPFTSWQTPEGVINAEVEIKLKQPARINVIKLQENIRDYGQRVEAFEIEAWIENEWIKIGQSTTIGFRKMIRLQEPVNTDRFRIRFLNSRISVSLGNISMYYLPPVSKEKTNESEQLYLKNTGWTISSFGIKTNNDSLSSIIDNNPDTRFKGTVEKEPAGFIVRFDKEYELKRFSYIPDQTPNAGHIEEYTIYFSLDGENWGMPVAQGRFGNIVNNPVEQVVSFKPQKVKFARIEIIKTTLNVISVPELNWFE